MAIRDEENIFGQIFEKQIYSDSTLQKGTYKVGFVYHYEKYNLDKHIFFSYILSKMLSSSLDDM